MEFHQNNIRGKKYLYLRGSQLFPFAEDATLESGDREEKEREGSTFSEL